MVDKYDISNNINLTSDDSKKDNKYAEHNLIKKLNLDKISGDKSSLTLTKSKDSQQKLNLKKFSNENIGNLISNSNKNIKFNISESKNDGSFFSRERKNHFSYKFQKVTELLNHTKKINDEYNREKMEILESQNRYKVSGYFVKNTKFFDIKPLKEKVKVKKYRIINKLVLKPEKLESKETTYDDLTNDHPQELCNNEEQVLLPNDSLKRTETKISFNKESLKNLSVSTRKKDSFNNFSNYFSQNTENSNQNMDEFEYTPKHIQQKPVLRNSTNLAREESNLKIYFKKRSKHEPFINGQITDRSRNKNINYKTNRIHDKESIDTPCYEYIEKAQKNIKEEFLSKYHNLIKSLNVHRASLF